MTPEEWEALCDGCGKCCRLEGDYACPGLDAKTKRCTVYDKRHTTYFCLPVTPDNVLSLHACKILPDSCAYVRHAKGQPPLDEPPFVEIVNFVDAPTKLRKRYNKALRKLLPKSTHFD